MAAIQVLSREKRMALPDLVATVEYSSRYGVKRRDSLSTAQGAWQFDTVQIDDAGQGNKADVVGTTADRTTMFVVIRVSEQLGGALVPEGRLNAGTLHTISMGMSEMPGICQWETQSIPGTGKANVSGGGPREVVRVEFDYCNANSSSHPLGRAAKQWCLSGADARLRIALCSAALTKPGQFQLTEMGDMRLGGTIALVLNAAECMQVASIAGAKRIQLPMSSVTDIASVPGELFAKFHTTFYSDPIDAVFEVLGVG